MGLDWAEAGHIDSKSRDQYGNESNPDRLRLQLCVSKQVRGRSSIRWEVRAIEG